jgi:Flp pilus assembly protein TadG
MRSLKSKRTVRGSVTVEIALIFPFLVWLTFGIIQYGYILNAEVEVTNLDRDAARFAAINGNNTAFYGSVTTTGSLDQFVQSECTGTGIAYSDLTITTRYIDTTTNNHIVLTAPPPSTGGIPIEVELDYNISKKILVNGLVPGLSTIAGQPCKRVTDFMLEYPLS